MSAATPCRAVEHDLLPDLVDGSLDAPGKASVEAHVTVCAIAQTELAELRALDAAALGNHLETTEIVSFAWDGVPSGETHLDFCSKCREEVDAVRAARLVEEKGDISKPSRRPTGSPSASFFWPTALAAVLVAGLGLALLFGRNAQIPPLVPSTTRGAAQIDNLLPIGSSGRDSRELIFSWAGPTDLRYAVSFLSAEGRLLSRVETLGTRLPVSGADLELLKRESEFFWKVEALSEGATTSGKVARISWRP